MVFDNGWLCKNVLYTLFHPQASFHPFCGLFPYFVSHTPSSYTILYHLSSPAPPNCFSKWGGREREGLCGLKNKNTIIEIPRSFQDTLLSNKLMPWSSGDPNSFQRLSFFTWPHTSVTRQCKHSSPFPLNTMTHRLFFFFSLKCILEIFIWHHNTVNTFHSIFIWIIADYLSSTNDHLGYFWPFLLSSYKKSYCIYPCRNILFLSKSQTLNFTNKDSGARSCSETC